MPPEPDVEEIDEDLDLPDFTDEDWQELEFEVPWHGVLAPIGVESGDRRMFSADAEVKFRDLPLPLKWMPEDQMGHTAARPVASIDRIWVEDGLIKGEGMFHAGNADAGIAMEQVALGIQRGVSVDLDMAYADYVNDDGTPFDWEAEPVDGKGPLAVVTEYRISASTLCAIPAFQEAFVALGTWADAEASAPEPTLVERFTDDQGGCPPCQALALIEQHSVEHAKELGADIEAFYAEFPSDAYGHPEEFEAADGTRYVFTAEGAQVFAPGTHDGPGWITNPKETQRLRTYWTRGKGALKIRWGQPGDFNRCRQQLAKYVPDPSYLAGTCANLHKVAIGLWPGMEASLEPVEGLVASAAYYLVASADQSGPPAAWFLDPELSGPTPITIDDEGRLFGHLALWESCHIGYPGECVAPPESAANYAYFRTGTVITDDGPVPVGQITMNTGHAPMRSSAKNTMAHYDNTGMAVADVAAGDDEHGIWVAGAVRPNLGDDERAALRAAVLSGDWRSIGGNLELVAALAVNVPGFPVPHASLVASGGSTQALVASGIIGHERIPLDLPGVTVSADGSRVTFTPADMARIVDSVSGALTRRERAATLRSEIKQARLATLRATMEE